MKPNAENGRQIISVIFLIPARLRQIHKFIAALYIYIYIYNLLIYFIGFIYRPHVLTPRSGRQVRLGPFTGF